MTEPVYGELACIEDNIAEFNLYSEHDEKLSYARYPAGDLPEGTDPGDVFTITLNENQDEITALEFNAEKTQEYQQRRLEAFDELD